MLQNVNPMRNVLLIVTSNTQVIECFANLTLQEGERLRTLIMSDMPEILSMECENLRVLVSTKSQGIVVLKQRAQHFPAL